MKKKVIAIVSILVVFLTVTVIGILAVLSEQQKQNIQEAAQQAWMDSIPKEQPTFLTALDDRSEFKCIKVERTDTDYYLATFEVASPNIQEDLNNFQENTDLSTAIAEEVNQQIFEIVQSADVKTTEQTATAILCDDDTYHIFFSDGFLDAMFGYAYMDAMYALMAEI